MATRAASSTAGSLIGGRMKALGGWLGLCLLAGTGCPSQKHVVDTKDGAYVTDGLGRIYRLQGNKMTEVQERAAKASDSAVIRVATDIPEVGYGTSLARLTGQVKVAESELRMNLRLTLAGGAGKEPTVEDQRAFVRAFTSGSGTLAGISLEARDEDGFPLGSDLQLPSFGWSRITAPGGAVELTFQKNEPWPVGMAKETRSFEVAWRTRP